MTKTNWMHDVHGIMNHKHLPALYQAIRTSEFASDADRFIDKIKADFRRDEIDVRRALYHAVMYVSAGCPFNETIEVQSAMGRGVEKINITKYLTYSQTLQALTTNSARHFYGSIITDEKAARWSMMHKWELFRSGYMVLRDTQTRAAFSIKQMQDISPKLYKHECEVARIMRQNALNETGIRVVV